MNAVQRLFIRLRCLLSTEQVAELERQYRQDARADGAASRKRRQEGIDRLRQERKDGPR